MTDDRELTVDALTEWARSEQVSLWYDFSDAVRRAANGVWSIQAANIASRIVECARLVGPSGHGEIPWSLVAGDVYVTLLEIADIPADLPDEAEWRHLEEVMSKHGHSREATLIQFAPTRAAMTSPCEVRFIRDE